MKRILMFMVLPLIFISCNDFLEEKPFSFKTQDPLFETESGVSAYLTGVYDCLASTQNGSFRKGLLIVTNFGTDDFTGESKFGASENYQNYTVISTDNNLTAIWNNFYAGINQASGIIQYLPDLPLDASFKKQTIAEAKFLRGFYYFHLVRMFGQIPLRTSQTNSLAITNSKKATIEQIYLQIIKDLETALPDLAEANQVVPGRATKGAAAALLTKVYLSLGSYSKYNPVSGYEWVNTKEAFSKAVFYGQQVLDMPHYSLVDDYGSIFNPETENGPEIIFSAQMASSTTIVDEGSFLENYFSPAAGGKGDDGSPSRGGSALARPTQNLVGRYQTGDKRKAWNVVNFSYKGCLEVPSKNVNPKTTYCGKFRITCGSVTIGAFSNVNFPLLRLADVMLMVAEADAELNGGNATPLATQIVQNLRIKRFAPLTPPAITASFLNFIMDERSRELCYESQRWFDLVRTAKLIDAVKATVVSTSSIDGPANINPNHYLFPIPQYEIDNNLELTQADQNPGY